MDTKTIRVFVKWVVKPKQLDKVLTLLQKVSTQSKAESGNLAYHTYQSQNDANTFFLIEEYTNAEALEIHKNSTHYKEIVFEQIIPLLDNREVHIVHNI